jgi:hypothetical protein
VTARKPYPDAEVMKELRANGWSAEGIARIYQITPFAVRLMIGEKEDGDA